MLTADLLRSLLQYDPATGLFMRLVKTNAGKPGWFAGSPDAKGYLQIFVAGKIYRAHRLAVLWMTGAWPPVFVDHRDKDKANNRWNNLRLATRAQNHANSKIRTDNKTGIRGVCVNYRNPNKWIAQIVYEGRYKYLGSYNSKEEAGSAYKVAAIRLFGEFASS